MVFLTPVLCSLALASCLVVVDAAGPSKLWTYDRSAATGPSNWPAVCSTGKRQSPVDIPRSGNMKETMEPFQFRYYDITPEKAALQNTGNTAKLTWTPISEDKVPQVLGGGLPATYKFAQFHYHWGLRDSQGSEHTISGVAFPMELHLVHFNSEYGKDIGEALHTNGNKNDTLAVLGIMFQLQSKNNSDLDPIINALEEIQESGTETYTAKFTLEQLLPEKTNEFYRYYGSLTTPGCNEIVVWTVFKNPVKISNRQMDRFRKLSTNVNPELQNNFRPTQALNGRKIVEVTGSGATSAAMLHPLLALVTLLTVFRSA